VNATPSETPRFRPCTACVAPIRTFAKKALNRVIVIKDSRSDVSDKA
jgi:hypothetical protein